MSGIIDIFKNASFAKTDGYRYVRADYSPELEQLINQMQKVPFLISSVELKGNRMEIGFDSNHLEIACSEYQELARWIHTKTKDLPYAGTPEEIEAIFQNPEAALY